MFSRPPTTEATFWPLFYGAVTGTSAGMSTYFAALLSGAPKPEWVGGSVGLAAFCMMYTLGQLVWAVILAKAWRWGDQPLMPGAPAAQAPPLVVIKDTETTGNFIKLPVPLERQRAFASAVLAGTPVRHRNMARLFGSSSEFSVMLDELVRQGLATRDNRGVVDLNSKGRAYCRALTTPPPRAPGRQ